MTFTFKSLSVIAAILFLSAPLHAQILVPHMQWQRCFGGSDVENHAHFVEPHDHMMIHTSDGGYAFVAGAASTDAPVMNIHFDSLGNPSFDIWLVKLDAQSNIQWSKCFGGTGTDIPCCLIQTSDGGYAMCGKTSSHDGDVTDADTAGSISDIYYADDAWVVKTDASGNKQWAHAFGWSHGDEVLNSIIEVSGGYIAVGGSTTADGAPEGHFHNKNTNLGDAFILRLNTKGEELWRKLYGAEDYDEAQVVLPLPNGGCLVAATQARTLNSPAFYALWILKLDSLGQISSQKWYGADGIQLLPKSMIAVDTEFVIAGCDLSPASSLYTPGAFILVIDSSGKQLNLKEFGGSGPTGINSIIRSSDGNLVFAGTTKSSEVPGYHVPIFDNIHNVDSADAWVGCMSPDLKLLWQHCYGGTYRESFYTVLENPDHSYSCYGSAEGGSLNVGTNGDISGIHGYADAWLVNVKMVEQGVDRGDLSHAAYSPYPNPAVNRVNMELSGNDAVRSVRIYDQLGVELFPEYRVQQGSVAVDLRNIPSGVYMLKVTYANRAEQVSKFLHASF
jgi:hypothetical protein